MALPLITLATGYGNYADRPAAGTAPTGGIFVATDKYLTSDNDGSNWLREYDRILFTQTSVAGGDTISNTVTPTTFATTYTIPSGYMFAGRRINVKWHGHLAFAVAGAVTLNARVGSTSYFSKTVTYGIASTKGWDIDLSFVCITTGAPGTAEMRALSFYETATGGTLASHCSVNTGTVALTTSSTQVIDLEVTFSVADAGNTITQRYMEVGIGGGV